MKIELKDRVALVAEGGNDLGKAVCKQLAESGARVTCLVGDEDNARQCRSYFDKAGVAVQVFSTDITDFSSCENTVNRIERDIGHIDIVVNNPESRSPGKFSELSKSRWAECMKVNLDSTYNLCRLISENMGERGFGRIINISSMYGRKGEKDNSAYAASKAGVHGFTMSLAQELARKGVTVNTVSPGNINADDVMNVPTAEANRMIAEIPLARFGEAGEVASLVEFLCSKQAGFITGTDIAINGGQYIH